MKDSPPRNERPSDVMMPPVALVSTRMPPSMLTIAPLSARTVSPAESAIRQSA